MRYFLFFIFIQGLIFSSISFSEDSKTTEVKMTYEQFKKNNALLLEALKKSERSQLGAIDIITKWNPTEDYLKTYKAYWITLWSDNLSEAKNQYLV